MKKYFLCLFILIGAISLSACETENRETNIEGNMTTNFDVTLGSEVAVDRIANLIEVLNGTSEEEIQQHTHSFMGVVGYENLGDLVASADLIVHGRVIDERVETVNGNVTMEEAIEGRMSEFYEGLISEEELDNILEFYENNATSFEPIYFDFFFYRIEILEIYQGNYEVGDIIEVYEFIGWYEISENAFRYEIGSEFVFFLRNLTSDGRLPYSRVNLTQSLYRVPTDSTDEEMLFEPVSKIFNDTVDMMEFESNISGAESIYDVSALPLTLPPFEINLSILQTISRENNLPE